MKTQRKYVMPVICIERMQVNDNIYGNMTVDQDGQHPMYSILQGDVHEMIAFVCSFLICYKTYIYINIL